MHYQAKRAFEPIIVVPEFRGSRIIVSLISDYPFEVEGDIAVNIYTPQGKKLGVWRNYVTLLPNVAQKVIDERLYDDPESKRPMIAVAHFISDVNLSYYGVDINEKWGDLKQKDPLIMYELITESGKTFIELKAKGYAFFVEISSTSDDLMLEDNFFHMIPNKKYRIRIIEGNANGLVVKSLWNYLNEI
jgi:hypothetical protein